MSKVWLSPHIDARFGQLPNEVLFTNVSYGTRIIAQDSSWEKLGELQKSGNYESGDAWLDRAKNAYLIREEEAGPWPDFVLRLEAALVTYLKRRTGSSLDYEQSADGLLKLVEAAEKVFLAEDMPSPYAGNQEFVGVFMKRPAMLIHFAFDHIKAFLEHDLNSDFRTLDFNLVQQFFDRPAMKLRYEQQFCTPETTQRRAEMMIKAMKPGSRVLVLGDDDLVSLALVEMTDQLKVDVLELDTELVAFLKEKGGDRLNVLECNLRYGVPDTMKGAYDCVTTDPPYAEDGMRFFIGCAKASMAEGPDSRLFLTTYPGLLENPDALWRDIAAQDLDILKTNKHFSRYVYNNTYRVNQLTTAKELGSPLHPTSELFGFPFLYADFFECAHSQESGE